MGKPNTKEQVNKDEGNNQIHCKYLDQLIREGRAIDQKLHEKNRKNRFYNDDNENMFAHRKSSPHVFNNFFD